MQAQQRDHQFLHQDQDPLRYDDFHILIDNHNSLIAYELQERIYLLMSYLDHFHEK